MSHKACIRFAPVLTLDRLNDGVRPGRKLYERGGLRFLPGRSQVPLLVNHDDDREIGFVHDLAVWEDTDGPWFVARATVTDPPAWLKRGVKASFGFSPLGRSETMRELHGVDVVRRGLVNEVSVLVGEQPAEPLAQVLLVERSLPAAVVPSDRAAAGEVIHDWTGQHSPEASVWAEDARKRGNLVRFGTGQVLGVR